MSNFKPAPPALPLAGIETLARLWAGSGTFLDWIAPEDWDFDLNWSATQVRARVADLILLRFARNHLKFLPRHAGEWIDVISQQLHRSLTRTDVPTAHTDWPSTLSEFGRYPSEQYIERRPIGSFDTAHTRILKWTIGAVRKADRLVQSQFGRASLNPTEKATITCALDLTEVATAGDGIKPDQTDLDVCKASGGAWLLVSRLAEELASIWFGSAVKQFHSLTPALPELGHQLFELGTLGTILNELRQHYGDQGWKAENPLASAKANQPCLTWTANDSIARIFFQTPCNPADLETSPYLCLARTIGGGTLRPDIWIQLSGRKELDVILECKYSNDPSYIASAVTQLIGYDKEFARNGRPRLLVAVGPAEVVPQPCSWNGEIALCNPITAASLIAAAAVGTSQDMMQAWANR